MGNDEAVLRDIGPKDIDSAGDMVAKVGVRNQAKRLITAVRDNYPRELVAALSRPEDQGRTKMLDEDEVKEVVKAAGWKDLTEVEGARVFGQGKQAHVGIVFRTESGRSARGAIPYSDFPISAAAYDAALSSGGVVVTDDEDASQLRRALEAAQKQLAEGGSAGPSEEELEAEVEKRVEAAKEAFKEEAEESVQKLLQNAGLVDEEGEPVEQKPPEPFEGYSEANADEVVAKLEELDLSALVALKAAEEAQEKPRKSVLEPLAKRLEAAENALKGD